MAVQPDGDTMNEPLPDNTNATAHNVVSAKEQRATVGYQVSGWECE